MSGRRNKFNYNSPYTKNASQYPSQTTDYMAQFVGGAGSMQSQHQPQNQNYGFYEDRQGNVPHFYQNTTPQQTPGRQQFAQHRPRWQQKSNFKERDTSSQYFHKSMLEDPWRDLVARHEAIHGSVVRDDSET